MVFKVAILALIVLGATTRAEVAAPTPAVGHYEAFVKNRYISIDPTAGGANLGKAFAIRVTLTDSLQFEAAEGMTWWVGEPDENCFAGLVDSESTRNWDACQTLFIGDCGIVPVSEYTVVSVDSSGDSPSSLVVLTTFRPYDNKWWGDAIGMFTGPVGTPPNVWTGPQGSTNWDDLTASLRTFQGSIATNATHVSVTDIHPRVLNRIVNIDDVFVFIKAFQGYQYPFGCPDDPCWDKLLSPCP